MSGQSPVVLILAFVLMIANLCGATFTILQIRSKRMREKGEPAAGASLGLTTWASFEGSYVKFIRPQTIKIGSLVLAAALGLFSLKQLIDAIDHLLRN
jgi:hypothetical protein